jgi:hypothetical protein
MSEAELHVLKARLRGGILNKVRRGEYHCPLPTGFVYDEVGNVALDHDAQIRGTITRFFETFSRVGSACQTVKAFRQEGLGFPARRTGNTTVFRPLTAWTALRVLNNPRYAGVYVYGRRRYRRAVDGKKKIQQKHDYGDWLACIPNAHSGYIVGSSINRTSSYSRPTVADTNWREGRRRVKARRCCRDERCAADAAGTSASGIVLREASKKPGISATAPTALLATRTANQSPAHPPMRPSGRSWSRG